MSMASVGSMVVGQGMRWVLAGWLSYTVVHVGESSCRAMCQLYLRSVAPAPWPTLWSVLELLLYRWKTVGRCGRLAWCSSGTSSEGVR